MVWPVVSVGAWVHFAQLGTVLHLGVCAYWYQLVFLEEEAVAAVRTTRGHLGSQGGPGFHCRIHTLLPSHLDASFTVNVGKDLRVPLGTQESTTFPVRKDLAPQG